MRLLRWIVQTHDIGLTDALIHLWDGRGGVLLWEMTAHATSGESNELLVVYKIVWPSETLNGTRVHGTRVAVGVGGNIGTGIK